MRKCTMDEKRRGELAMRDLSAKAEKMYNETDPLAVYEYDTEEGTRYAIRGALGDIDDMTFEDVDRLFSDSWGEIEGEA